jgi:hypothetical protein
MLRVVRTLCIWHAVGVPFGGGPLSAKASIRWDGRQDLSSPIQLS